MKRTCPECERLFIKIDENGYGWCIKCGKETSPDTCNGQLQANGLVNTQAILKKMRELINQPCWSKSWELYDELEQILTAQEMPEKEKTGNSLNTQAILDEFKKRTEHLQLENVYCKILEETLTPQEGESDKEIAKRVFHEYNISGEGRNFHEWLELPTPPKEGE